MYLFCKIWQLSNIFQHFTFVHFQGGGDQKKFFYTCQNEDNYEWPLKKFVKPNIQIETIAYILI